MPYAVKEIYSTIQGEGHHVGRAAVFCRFSGCNLWSGREADRASAACNFCDTDFVGMDGANGGRYADAESLADRIAEVWDDGDQNRRFVVFTGGEPLLQLDEALIEAVRSRGFYVALETNGTKPLIRGIDWVCVSPKGDAELAIRSGDELKLVYPQPGVEPESFAKMEFEHFFLQPLDGPKIEANRQAAFAYCRRHPQWRVSVQLHKLLQLR